MKKPKINLKKIDFKNIDFKKISEKAFGTQGLIVGAGIFIVVFLVIITMQSCQPRTGSIIYGICGAFLEQQVVFPSSIRHNYVEQFPRSIRIYYTHLDSFGQKQIETIECRFRQDPIKGVQMDRIFFSSFKEITEKERLVGQVLPYVVKQDVIDRFNDSLSAKAIVSQEPDLTLP